MQILFCDEPEARLQLYPLCYTRPISDLRCGILTITEKWQRHLQVTETGHLTANYLQEAFPPISPTNDTIWIFNGLLPDTSLVYNVRSLEPGEAIYNQGKLIAARGKSDPRTSEYQHLDLLENPERISYTWDLFRLNGSQIRADYELLTKGRKSHPLDDPFTRTYGAQIFLEEGARVKSAILNSETGPIYLGKNSEIQEGAIIRGPFGVGEGSIINMGAKVRGDTSLGPFCKIGGEVSNSVLWGYSNKGHDGFLGNSVLGQWCNLGADTNTSNLKNTYEPVKMWSYLENRFIDTGLQFCGLVMGDHSKTGINTMFNTGTTVGVASNIFGDGFPRNVIPSFAWGGAAGLVTHHPRKALITADAVMQRRNMPLTETERAILNHIFEETAPYRVWEKS